MGTANITIEVDAAAARAFAEASPGEQQKLQLLLSLRLQELTAKQGGTLQSVMDETGRAAEGRGLTPEILENLLRDDECAGRGGYQRNGQRSTVATVHATASV